jgi:hypothetical protein
MRSVRKSSPLLLRKWTLELRGRWQRPTVRVGRWCKLSIFMDTYLIQKTYEGLAHRLAVQRAEGLSLEPVTTFSKTTSDQEHILLACMRLHGILPTLCAILGILAVLKPCTGARGILWLRSARIHGMLRTCGRGYPIAMHRDLVVACMGAAARTSCLHESSKDLILR